MVWMAKWIGFVVLKLQQRRQKGKSLVKLFLKIAYFGRQKILFFIPIGRFAMEASQIASHMGGDTNGWITREADRHRRFNIESTSIQHLQKKKKQKNDKKN